MTIQEDNGQRNVMTEKEFRAWQGADHLTYEEMEELLLDIVNGIYSIEDFIDDVRKYE